MNYIGRLLIQLLSVWIFFPCMRKSLEVYYVDRIYGLNDTLRDQGSHTFLLRDNVFLPPSVHSSQYCMSISSDFHLYLIDLSVKAHE